MTTRVLPDANVLFSRTIRDWVLLLHLGHPDRSSATYFTYYTEDILAETVSRMRDKYPYMDGTNVTRVRDRIAKSMTERISDYPDPTDAPIPDIGDYHLHAAAVAGGIDILVTDDRGFTTLDPIVAKTLPYEVYTSDDFLMLVEASWPDVVRAVTRQQFEYWTASGCSNIATPLVKAGCPQFADRVRAHLQAL